MINQTNPSVTFSAEDRCDRCRAQAYILAAKNGSELLFCGHHFKAHSVALEMDNWTIAYDYVALDNLVPNSRSLEETTI